MLSDASVKWAEGDWAVYVFDLLRVATNASSHWYHEVSRMVNLSQLSAGLLISVLFLSGCSPQLKVVAIRVPEMGMCVDYDPVARKPIEPVMKYPAGTRKVTVYFRTDPDVAGDVSYRWYKEGTFLGQQVAPAETGYNFGWMTGSAALPAGSYEVVVAMVGGVELRRTSFVISP